MKDGGPAFPTTRSERLPSRGEEVQFAEVTYPGMSLRDWFAGQAIRARWGDGTTMTEVEAAQFAYQLADAMLAAREAPND